MGTVAPGMKLLSEDERQSTVKQLNDTKAQIEDDLRRLPFNIETPSQIKHKSGCVQGAGMPRTGYECFWDTQIGNT